MQVSSAGMPAIYSRAGPDPSVETGKKTIPRGRKRKGKGWDCPGLPRGMGGRLDDHSSRVSARTALQHPRGCGAGRAINGSVLEIGRKKRPRIIH